jgi:hypothetical protein
MQPVRDVLFNLSKDQAGNWLLEFWTEKLYDKD